MDRGEQEKKAGSALLEELKNRILFFDGGTGSLLQAAGLGAGELPETWNISHPETVVKIHRDYLNAGCDMVKTNTFGANRLKFNDHTEFTLKEVVEAAVANARQAAREAGHGWIALDLGPTGRLLKPMGDLEFETAVSMYRETALIGVQAGADLILIETMSDSYELKAAVLGAKEALESLGRLEGENRIPIFATVIFDGKGKLLTGGTARSVIALLEGLGVDALGVNCGLGPVEMKEIVKEYVQYASLPIIVNPNAGLPRSEGGKTVYVPADITYADWTAVYVDKSKTLEEWLKDHPSETTKGKDDIIKNIIGLRNTYQQQLSAGTEAKDREITIKEAGSEVIKLLDTKELRSITQELNRQVETRKAYYNNWLNAKTKEEKQKWAHEHNTMLKSWKALKADYTFKCADLVKSVLEKFIEIGPGDAPIKEHLYDGRAKMAKYVLDAYSYYPRKWVNESIRAGKIHVKSVKRGYYDGETIALSGDGDYETFRTCVHELGHRMEDVILRILEQEKAFYDRRTDGESLVWLGEITGNPNYRKSEMTRPDKFLNPYMGKDYHGTAYELVSMGVELAYTDTVKLLDDEDMAEWIFGMLAVV